MTHWDKRIYTIKDHSLCMDAKSTEKLKFLTPWYAHVRIRGLEILVFQKILRTY